MKSFFKRRFKGLWWPFVKWSVIFMLLHNVFAAWHLYDNTYTWKDMAYKLFHIVTMTGSEQLLGGYWFLKELLYASVISIIALKLVYVVLGKKADNGIQIGIFLTLLFLVCAYVLSIAPFKIPTIGSRTLLSAACYFAGYTFHKLPNHNRSNLYKGLIYLSIVVVVSFFYTGSMSVTGYHVFIYFIVAMIGSVGVINLAGLIKGSALKVLNYVGSKTLYILTFHFIAFKLVSLMWIGVYDFPIYRLSDFPVIPEVNMFSWIVYSIVGVVVPISLWNISKFIQTKKGYIFILGKSIKK